MALRSFLALILGFLSVGGEIVAAEALCEKLDFREFSARSQKWKGREVVAFASWCSSCKNKILDAQKSPDGYVLISAFDDVDASEKVLRKFKIASPCVYGDDLIKQLDITQLPWSKKI